MIVSSIVHNGVARQLLYNWHSTASEIDLVHSHDLMLHTFTECWANFRIQHRIGVHFITISEIHAVWSLKDNFVPVSRRLHTFKYFRYSDTGCMYI